MNSSPQNNLQGTSPFIPSQPQIGIPQQILPQAQSDIPVGSISQNQLQPQPNMPHPETLDPKRHRRSKHEQEGRIYQCECGKAYLSQPALNNHKKSKHPELNANGEKRGRGRPRKYLPNFPGDFETNKYDNFFLNSNRKKDDANPWEMQKVVTSVFDFLFKGPHKSKLFSQPERLEDNVLLNSLKDTAPISQKQKNEKTCDDVFYEYLVNVKDQVCESYFTLILEFVLLFRECFNKNKSTPNPENPEEKKEPSSESLPDTLPELCNEFYTNFMETNDFFGIENEGKRTEIIEIIQHFCIWLFKNDYTKSKLSLAQ